MPLYEYECEACAHRFERIQRYADPPIETCPTCGSKVRKLISSPAIQFKGSGFYITDYPKSGSDLNRSGSKEKSGEGKSGEGKSSESSSADGGGSAAKSESKSESKSSEPSSSKPSESKPAPAAKSD